MTEEKPPKTKSQIDNQKTEKESADSSYGSGLVIVNTVILAVFAIIALIVINNNGYFEKYSKSKPAPEVIIQEAQKEDKHAPEEAAASESEWVTPHISKQARIHILYGDETGGAHFHTVTTPCKSLFPKDWDADKVIEVTEKIAANDNLEWKPRKNGKMFAQEMHDGILTRVIMDSEREYVITSYPLNADRNPCPDEGDKMPVRNGKAVKETKYFKVLDSVDTKTKSQKDYNQ